MSLRNSSYNMAAQLSTCAVEEQRSVIRFFLWPKGVKPSEIYRRMEVQDGDSCLSQGRVYEWVERFQNRRQNVSYEHWSGRPVTVATETMKQQISSESVTTGESLTIDETAVELNMSHGSAYCIVHYDLGYMRMCSKSVPRQFVR
jgi:hypothetical protein